MTATPTIAKLVCRRCYTVLDVGDRFCRHCGAPLGQADPQPPAPVARPGSPWLALAALLLFGPLGLPMLWRSRGFSPGRKVLLTLVVLILTAAVVWMAWYVLYRSLEPLRHLQGLHGA